MVLLTAANVSSKALVACCQVSAKPSGRSTPSPRASRRSCRSSILRRIGATRRIRSRELCSLRDSAKASSASFRAVLAAVTARSAATQWSARSISDFMRELACSNRSCACQYGFEEAFLPDGAPISSASSDNCFATAER